MVTKPPRAAGGRRKIRTGIAISSTEICAVDLRLAAGARGWRMSLDPPADNGGGWPSLTSALSELERTLGVSDGILAIALMPPLTEVRRVELPPLADDDVERLLSRNAGKYFVTARAPQLVGATVTRRGRGQPTSVVAAAAPATLVAKIHGAARDAGWTVDETGPAESAWAAAAVALWPAFAKHSAHLLVTLDDRIDVLQLEEGRLAGVRRFRGGASEANLIADAIRDAGSAARVGAFGRAGPRGELVRALSERRITVELPVGPWAEVAESADLAAAHFAGETRGGRGGPILRSAEARATERVAARRATMLVGVAAAALLLIAGALELWGVHRELGIVRAERERLKPQIASTFVGRSTIEAAYGHIATLSGMEQRAPRWSDVMTDLTAALPRDAHLVGVRMRADSIVVDGFAPHAARVFDALERMPQLTKIRAAAPVRREVQEDKTALEHFAIAGIVRAPDTSTASASSIRTAGTATRKAGQ